MYIFLLLGCTFVWLYFYIRYKYGYWKRKGIYGPEPSFPGGHLGDALLGKTQLGIRLSQLYEENKRHPFVGLFMLHTKVLFVQDLDLIKTIMVKDFAHFPDHGMAIDPHHDPLSNHLFNMEGNEWKALRAKLTSTFTSSKMKFMFDTVLDCSNDLVSFLDKEAAAGRNVDFKETMAKYGTDVIGSCAFGIEANSFKYKETEFRHIGRRIFETGFVKSFKDIVTFYAPTLVTMFRIRMIPRDVEDFLCKTIKENMKYRDENNISKKDFLQLLMDMKKNDEKSQQMSLSQMEITAQSFLFFAAGFETSATTSTFAFYELAKNPEAQSKVREEIVRMKEKHGKLTFECVNEMEYLTHVIEETLRMYPPLPFLFRKCAKDYVLPDTDITIEKGTRVIIPIMGIQRDPDVHKNPMKFFPERFSTENRTFAHKFSSIPFGEGPRVCIGNRFGMMQTKLGIISVISNYELTVCDKTMIPMVLDPRSLLLSPKGGQYLKVIKINRD